MRISFITGTFLSETINLKVTELGLFIKSSSRAIFNSRHIRIRFFRPMFPCFANYSILEMVSPLSPTFTPNPSWLSPLDDLYRFKFFPRTSLSYILNFLLKWPSYYFFRLETFATSSSTIFFIKYFGSPSRMVIFNGCSLA